MSNRKKWATVTLLAFFACVVGGSLPLIDVLQGEYTKNPDIFWKNALLAFLYFYISVSFIYVAMYVLINKINDKPIRIKTIRKIILVSILATLATPGILLFVDEYPFGMIILILIVISMLLLRINWKKVHEIAEDLKISFVPAFKQGFEMFCSIRYNRQGVPPTF